MREISMELEEIRHTWLHCGYVLFCMKVPGHLPQL